jgi:HEPN domain-containing protein
MGAAKVLAIAPDVPPKTKSLRILVEVLGCEPEEEGEDCIVIINKEKL